MKLTDAVLENARYEGKSYRGKKGRKAWSKHIIWDDELEGFGVRIFPTKRKTFVVSFDDRGKKRMKTLGVFGELTLAEAREAAAEFLGSTDDETATESEAPLEPGSIATFADLTELFAEKQLADRGTTALAQRRLIRHRINPLIGPVPLAQIKEMDLWRLRAQVVRRFPEDAGRLSNLMRVIFRWASDEGLWGRESLGDVATGEAASSAAPDGDGEDAGAHAEAEEDSAEEIESEEAVVATPESAPEETEAASGAAVGGSELARALEKTRAELKAVRRDGKERERKLQSAIDDGEARISKLSLSVQQLQEALREAEEAKDAMNRRLDEAAEGERAARRELAALSAREQSRSAQARPVPRTESAVSVASASGGSGEGSLRRLPLVALAGALALGGLMGAAVVALLGGGGVSEPTPRPAVAAREAVPAAAPGEAPGDPTADGARRVEAGAEAPGSGTGPSDEPTETATAGDGVESGAVEMELEPSVPVPEPTARGVSEPVVAETPETEISAETDFDLASVEAAIEGWRSAWSAQRVDDYLASYAEVFVPPIPLTRREWEEQRRSRLLAPGRIELSLGPISFSPVEPGRVTAEFDQSYATESYSDLVTKTLVLVREGDEWKIADEQSR